MKTARLGRRALGIVILLGAAAFLAWKLLPSPAEDLYERGQRFRAVKMTVDAREAFQEAIRRDPKFAPPYRSLAEMSADHGRYDIAAEYWKEYIAREPNAEHAYCRLAREELRSGLEVPALNDAEEELKRDRMCARAHLVAGMLYTRKSEPKRAIEHMTVAAAAYPEELPVQLTYGRVLTLTANYREAESVLKRILERDRSHAEPFLWLGYGYARLPATPQNTRQAKEYLRQSLALNPDYAEANSEMARLLYSQGNAIEALPYARNATLQRKHHPPALYQLAQIYQTLGRSAEAEAARKKFKRESDLAAREKALLRKYKNDPDDVENTLELGEVELARERPEEALLFLRDAALHAPNDARILAAIAKAEKMLGAESTDLADSSPQANQAHNGGGEH